MARPSYATAPARFRFAIPVAVVVLTVFALSTRRLTGWVSGLSGIVLLPTAPLSQWLTGFTRGVLGRAGQTSASDERTRALEEERQTFYTMYLRERAENLQLRDFISELQRGVALNPNQPVRQVITPIIGTGADTTTGLLTARVPADLVADRNTVAATTGLQLVGRVSSGGGTSVVTLTPITLRNAGKIRGIVMSDETNFSLAAELSPRGDGTLRGVVRVLESRIAPGTRPPEPMPGQLVRLDDPDWSPSSTMLIVGRVESVDPSPEESQRLMITVRPLVNVERVARVLLRFDVDAEGSGGEGVKR